MDIHRTELLPGVFLSTLHTDKFKSDCLSVSLLTQLDRDTVSKNALLPRVLSRGTAFHKDMDAISAACDELYGARIIPCVRKKGEILAVGNADPRQCERRFDQVDGHRLYYGQAGLVLRRLPGQTGVVVLRAEADGVKAATASWEK